MVVSGQCYALAELYPRGKDPRYPLDWRQDGPQKWSGHRGWRKIPFPLPGTKPRLPDRSDWDSQLSSASTWSIKICLACVSYEVAMNWNRPEALIAAGVAQSVQCLTTDWATGRSRLDRWQRQRIFPAASVSRQALGPTQAPVQLVPGVISQGGEGRDADHSPPSNAKFASRS
jgi:hypothetical protein